MLDPMLALYLWTVRNRPDPYSLMPSPEQRYGRPSRRR
jgi:hypothetical protein